RGAAIDHGRYRQGTREKHSFQAECQRSDTRGDDRSAARNHRILTPGGGFSSYPKGSPIFPELVPAPPDGGFPPDDSCSTIDASLRNKNEQRFSHPRSKRRRSPSASRRARRDH